MNSVTLKRSLFVGALLFVAQPGLAAAAPADVIFDVDAAGNSVTRTIANNSDAPIVCESLLLPGNSSTPADPASHLMTVEILAGNTGTDTRTIPNGTYDVLWGCVSNESGPEEYWGNVEAAPGDPTGPPIRLTVPPTMCFFGSACLPG